MLHYDAYSTNSGVWQFMDMLVGNSFPVSLIRGCGVVIHEITTEELIARGRSSHVYSYWGHENTRMAAEKVLGVSLKPESERPAVVLDEENRPSLGGRSFSECYVLSPDYRRGFRPAIGSEVAPADITGWHALKIEWKTETKGE